MTEYCPFCNGILDPGSDFLWCGKCQEGFAPEDLAEFGDDDGDFYDDDLDFGLRVDDQDYSELQVPLEKISAAIGIPAKELPKPLTQGQQEAIARIDAMLEAIDAYLYITNVITPDIREYLYFNQFSGE